MQIMDQIEGVNGQLLPWEGDRLTPQVRSTSHNTCFHNDYYQISSLMIERRISRALYLTRMLRLVGT
jgi:hypothetical protein